MLAHIAWVRRIHAEQRIGGRGVVQVQDAAGVVVDDLALAGDERDEVRDPAVVDKRLHRRPDAGQPVGIETKGRRAADGQG